MKKIANSNGRLLINLLIAFGIMALLSTVAIPYLNKYQPNIKLNGVARDITSDLRLAQQLTITEQVVHIVKFNVLADSYEILRIDTATTTIKSANLPAEVSFQQITDLTDNQVVFNSYGGVSEAGEIFLINANNKIASVNIKPSGYVQLLE